MRKLKLLLFTLLILASIVFHSCDKEDKTPPTKGETDYVSKIVNTPGGVVENSSNIKIIIPEGAVPDSTEVAIGIRGNETVDIPNKNLKVIGQLFTVAIGTDSLGKSAIIEFDKPSDFTTEEEVAYFAYDGQGYMPLFYEVKGNKIQVQLDIIQFSEDYKSNLRTSNVTGGISVLVIVGLVIAQTPNLKQMGLKEVDVDVNNKMTFKEVGTINSDDKCVIFIHGWISNPKTWQKFIPMFKAKTNGTYTKILTFGYNSSLGIDANGQKLANVLSTKFQGKKKADIVGHSMGGLVSRAAIENHNAASYVNTLITLGTPHKGSPLAALRYFIGDCMLIDAGIDGGIDYIFYNMTTQGFGDLLPTSKFIDKLNSNPESTVPYYAVAAENEPCLHYKNHCWIASREDILPGHDDGVVAQSSALGVRKNNTLGSQVELKFANYIAHTQMTSSEGICNLVALYLNKMNKEEPAEQLPTLTTTAISSITTSSASTGGNISNQGSSAVTTRGVCYGTSSNPTVSNVKTSNGTGTGSFTSAITGLTANATYYVRAYATNSSGKAYGNEVSFKAASNSNPYLNPSLTYGSVTDIDGNKYATIKIGSQTWMAENLRTTNYNDGTTIPHAMDDTAWIELTTGAYSIYNFSSENETTYGKLYNWYAVNTGKLCPNGWHIPTDAEWTQLNTYLGSNVGIK